MPWPRVILHLDMDAFFAAVEEREDPSLRGKPLLIGHDGPRGVVATASYAARVFGCHSAQPMAVARRLCPHAVVLPVRMDLYRHASDRVFSILETVSPSIEPLSIDEAFADLTGTDRLLGPPADVARRTKRQIRAELSLTASVGLAPNKFLAKLASDMDKPDGLTVIGPDDVERVLPPLPVTRIWGVGKVTAERMRAYGITTIADLRRKDFAWLQKFFGSDADHYHRLARGQDDRPVVPDSDAKSIGHEQTFEVNVADPSEVKRVMFDQAEQVAARLRRHAVLARGVSLKIRFGDFQTINRSTTLPRPTGVSAELWTAAEELFDAWPFHPVRLIGVTAERLTSGPTQQDLFPDPDRQRQQKLDALSDRINQKFGKRSIHRAGPG